MTSQNPWLWPANGHIFIRNGHGVELNRSSDRHFDLADGVMSGDWKQRTVIIAFSFDGEPERPSEPEALRLANLIRDDFGSDGYSVTLTRLEADKPDTYTWRARVRAKL